MLKQKDFEGKSPHQSASALGEEIHEELKALAQMPLPRTRTWAQTTERFTTQTCAML